MKKKDTKDMTNKEKLEMVFRLLNPRERKYYRREDNSMMQEVTFEVTDNGELRYIISCLLRTCILALDSENDFASPRLSNCSKDGRQPPARCTIGELRCHRKTIVNQVIILNFIYPI